MGDGTPGNIQTEERCYFVAKVTLYICSVWTLLSLNGEPNPTAAPRQSHSRPLGVVRCSHVHYLCNVNGSGHGTVTEGWRSERTGHGGKLNHTSAASHSQWPGPVTARHALRGGYARSPKFARDSPSTGAEVAIRSRIYILPSCILPLPDLSSLSLFSLFLPYPGSDRSITAASIPFCARILSLSLLFVPSHVNNQRFATSRASTRRVTPATMATVQKTSGGNNAYHNFHNDFVHVQDLNERRRLALAEVDRAPFGWYHVRAVMVAGVGFFTDSYDIFTVSLLTMMLGVVYYPGVGQMPTNSDTAIKLATSAGTVVGQLGFGALADIVGRKRMYGLELILIIFATLAQALTSSSPSMDIVGVIIFWRVVMVGVPFASWSGTTTDARLVNRALELAVTTHCPVSSRPSSRRQNGEAP